MCVKLERQRHGLHRCHLDLCSRLCDARKVDAWHCATDGTWPTSLGNAPCALHRVRPAGYMKYIMSALLMVPTKRPLSTTKTALSVSCEK